MVLQVEKTWYQYGGGDGSIEKAGIKDVEGSRGRGGGEMEEETVIYIHTHTPVLW